MALPSAEGFQVMQPSQQRLGAILRGLRTQQGLSIRTLAARAGFSPSFISQVESDSVSPSIASLEKIATALGVTLGQLFTSLEHATAARTVIRAADRTTYTSAWSKSTIAVLSDFSPQRALSAVGLTIFPGGMSSRHPEARVYDTFATVTAGNITLIVESGESLLTPGDSAYLSAGTPFAWANQGDLPATLLMVGSGSRIDLAKNVVSEATREETPTRNAH
jgi:transcriptional regulator with XRE-family HTH domain